MAVIRSAGQGEVERVRTALGDRVISRVELDGPGFLTVLAGFLLVLPGFLTDIIGALLLLPPTRRLIHAALRRAVGARRARERAGPRWSIFRPGPVAPVPENASATSHPPGTIEESAAPCRASGRLC